MIGRWTRTSRAPGLQGARLLIIVMALLAPCTAAFSSPYTPSNDALVLAELPPGSTHTSAAAREAARTRADVALPLAQFYISRARATGDLRYLGYAEGTLKPWLSGGAVQPAALVLDATIQQSRHAFVASLAELDRALGLQADNAQAWLTRATVLRVLGRYAEAMASCEHLAPPVDPAITQLCEQSLRALTGHLQGAYDTLVALPQATLPREVRAWRYSELGEMAERSGDDVAAEHWLREGVALAPEDFYMRAAYADLLLRHRRAADTLQLLAGYDSMEPMLLRIVIARKMLDGSGGAAERARLEEAFALEEQRGEAVHRREQARFLLDIDQRPMAALVAAQQDWRVQQEPDDVLILLCAAQAAHRPDAAAPVLQFLAQQHLEDVRLDGCLGNGRP